MSHPTRIRVERPRPAVSRIVLARPDKRNAQDPTMLYELDAAFADAVADASVRVIILAGDGPDFSSGHDLSADFALPGRSVATLEGGVGEPGIQGPYSFEAEAFVGMCRRWREVPKPTIAQVQGRVIAGGLMLVWPMDLVVASSDATFSDPVAVLGVNAVEYFVHVHELGARRTKEILFTGDAITADEAKSIGMVTRVVDRDDLESATLELAERIAGRPAFGLRLAKTSVNRAQDAQGMQQAIDTAFALHHVGHANNLARFGSLIDPTGIAQIRESAKSPRPMPTADDTGRGHNPANR